MSTAAHLGTLEIVRESLAMLGDAIQGLPPDALDWTPAHGTNSIAVLVRHALTSTVFWVSAGSGRDPSHRAYIAQERLPAFESRGLSAAALAAEIQSTLREVEAILRDGEERHLAALQRWPDSDVTPRTGAACLVHAAAHLREHVGQAQLTRDLWLAWAAEA